MERGGSACYIPPMRSILKPILLGLFISTALMITIYVSAVMGSGLAISMLLKMTMPQFNVVAMLMDPVVPDDPESGGQAINLLLLVAWMQISLISAVAAAAARAALARQR